MRNKRLWSLGLIGVLAVSACGCGQKAEPAEAVAEETVQAEKIAKRAVQRSRSADGAVEKEETVYVNADASGTVKNITVSNWLKNVGGASSLSDVTTLTDVVNVKGDETFTQDGDTYVWQANGNDIYYQGETSESLPVDVKVTYYLDDEEIAPEELAGKSGKVKIRFDYDNLTAQQTIIGDEKTALCVPFIAASTMILDSDKFVNVEVENGKILSDGKNTIVAGVAMPGLYESLDLMNLEGFEDIDIPEYVEVTADVTEFELAMTATVLIPDVFSELDTDDMDGFDDLKDDIEELNDATYDLIDGCIELDDGVQELKDNMPDLWDGVTELDDGAWELDDGAQELMDGADELNDGAKDIREGAKAVDEGTGTLKDGVGFLDDRMPELTGGVNALAAGLESLQNPMMLGPDGKSGDAEHPYIKTSVGLLKDGVDTLAAGVGSMGNALNQAIAENQKEMQTAGANVAVIKGNLEKAVREAHALQDQLTELAKQLGMLPEESGSTDTKKASAPMQETPATGQEETPEAMPEKTLLPEQEDSSEKSKTPDTAQTEIPSVNAEENPADVENPADKVTEEAPAAVPESPAAAPTEEQAAAPEEKPSAATESPAAAPEEEPAVAPESPSSVPEETFDSTEEPAAEESESNELSAFAEDYLNSLNETDGMAPMSMVQTADGGENTDPSDMQAVIQGYRTVVALQTQLIEKLNEITELQNELRDAATEYAGLAGADTALKQIAGQVSASADTEKLAQLTEGMAALEISIGQIYDGVALINSQMGTLTGGAADLSQGVGALKTGADTLKDGTAKLYQGGIDLREGTKELYDGTRELKDGTEELKDGTGELKDGVVDLVDGVDELKDGTAELLDGVNEYNEDGIQKLYETVNVDLQNLLDRVDAISDLSGAYQSFSGKSEAMEGSVKFIIETDAIEVEED